MDDVCVSNAFKGADSLFPESIALFWKNMTYTLLNDVYSAKFPVNDPFKNFIHVYYMEALNKISLTQREALYYLPVGS